MRDDLAKLAAVAVGAAICLALLTAWRLPTSGSPPGLDLRLIAIPPGELTVDPTGTIASGHAMQAGGEPVGGDLLVRNIAGQPLRAWLVALPSARGPARQVQLRAVASGRTIATGSLASLRLVRGRGLTVPPRGTSRIEISAWLPAGATGYRGRILDVPLEFRATPLRSGA